MNENANPQAFPALATTRDQYIGLTKRELFAAILGAGLLAGDVEVKFPTNDIVHIATETADALLAELDKPQETEPEADAD